MGILQHEGGRGDVGCAIPLNVDWENLSSTISPARLHPSNHPHVDKPRRCANSDVSAPLHSQLSLTTSPFPTSRSATTLSPTVASPLPLEPHAERGPAQIVLVIVIFPLAFGSRSAPRVGPLRADVRRGLGSRVIIEKRIVPGRVGSEGRIELGEEPILGLDVKRQPAP
jgi:hypothetical protein